MKNDGARWMSVSPKGVCALVILLLVALVCFSETASKTVATTRAPVAGLKQAYILNTKERSILNPAGPFYRHSVIPGGVRQAVELTSALARDHYAKAHYANFDAANAYVVQLKAPRLVHVSYRVGDEIYWTKKKLQLKAGETLLTDGKSFVRTRCGNRIADTPQSKVSDKEPPPEAFELITPPPGDDSGNRPPAWPQDAAPHSPPFNGPPGSADNPAPPGGSGGSIPRPPGRPLHHDVNPVPPFVWDRNPPPHPWRPPTRPDLPDDVPTPVPEPATLALAMLALLGLFLSRRRAQPK